jgi:hypothetical protein
MDGSDVRPKEESTLARLGMMWVSPFMGKYSNTIYDEALNNSWPGGCKKKWRN